MNHSSADIMGIGCLEVSGQEFGPDMDIYLDTGGRNFDPGIELSRNLEIFTRYFYPSSAMNNHAGKAVPSCL